jgi:hypothetical protein
MELQDRLKFRELLFLLLAGLEKYPGDKERAEQGINVIEKFIDGITEREMSAILSKVSTLESGGVYKGGFKNKN